MRSLAKYWTVADASRFLGITGEGVRKAANGGRLPVALRLSKGQRLFWPDDVRQFGRQRDERSDRQQREGA